MLKALFKKQLMEVNTWLIQDKRHGKNRGKTSMILLVLVYAVLFVGLGMVFVMTGNMLCPSLAAEKLDWLYFAIMGLIAIMLGVFGSVFNTYATLYMAKDNEFLLAMPIPPSAILSVRLFGIWMWSLIYESIVFIPAVLVYWKILLTQFPSKALSASVILCDILLLLAISVLILSLSCILGWVVAKIGSKLKNKSIVTVLLSLLFLALYYWGYSRAYQVLQGVLANAGSISGTIQKSVFPLYLLGKAGTGSWGSAALFVCLIAAAFAVIWFVLNRTFLNLATENRGASKRNRQSVREQAHSIPTALLLKEIRRFTSSATYMLNCALGVVIMPIAAIFLLIKGAEIRELFMDALQMPPDMLLLLGCAGLCTLSSTIIITAPSVSLEGSHLWLAQSLPIMPWQVLEAKLKLHLFLAEIPLLMCQIALIYVLHLDILDAVLLVAIPDLFAAMSACFGLVLNLKMPNLNWTDETVPVKRSAAVMIAMLGGWLLVACLGIACFLLSVFLSARLLLLLCGLLFAGLTVVQLLWLKKRGSVLFSVLS